jgi:hypothetical protein
MARVRYTGFDRKNGGLIMDSLGTTYAANVGSKDRLKNHFTSTYQQIKASIVSVLMWLSVIGGAL